jgi:hypothetical protein
MLWKRALQSEIFIFLLQTLELGSPDGIAVGWDEARVSLRGTRWFWESQSSLRTGPCASRHASLQKDTCTNDTLDSPVRLLLCPAARGRRQGVRLTAGLSNDPTPHCAQLCPARARLAGADGTQGVPTKCITRTQEYNGFVAVLGPSNRQGGWSCGCWPRTTRRRYLV